MFSCSGIRTCDPTDQVGGDDQSDVHGAGVVKSDRVGDVDAVGRRPFAHLMDNSQSKFISVFSSTTTALHVFEEESCKNERVGNVSI